MFIHSFPSWGSGKFELPCDVFSHKVVLQPLALPYLLHPACGGLEYRGVVCNIVTRGFYSGNERIQFSLKLSDRRFRPHHSQDRTTEEHNVALASLLRGFKYSSGPAECTQPVSKGRPSFVRKLGISVVVVDP